MVSYFFQVLHIVATFHLNKFATTIFGRQEGLDMDLFLSSNFTDTTIRLNATIGCQRKSDAYCNVFIVCVKQITFYFIANVGFGFSTHPFCAFMGMRH
jgi:hypothetical protein